MEKKSEIFRIISRNFQKNVRSSWVRSSWQFITYFIILCSICNHLVLYNEYTLELFHLHDAYLCVRSGFQISICNLFHSDKECVACSLPNRLHLKKFVSVQLLLVWPVKTFRGCQMTHSLVHSELELEVVVSSLFDSYLLLSSLHPPLTPLPLLTFHPAISSVSTDNYLLDLDRLVRNYHDKF